MCATSIGSTFSQSPVCGVRKSGIPDGTEIPAPVSATARSAERSSSASRAAGASFTFEVRRPLPEERADALARVLRGEDGAEAHLLGLDAVVELALIGDP